ncbi:homocysteine-responsive endoplasmic reticulum-resident ubiquitin-like domain member 2 protein isoform X2 [Nilaparvata lugens]|nr:homocysteine-responsive endoplasmic reticulum-resident ubiquitin-like domain member 2 protein isoform X2 [Nilaparvata lugens]
MYEGQENHTVHLVCSPPRDFHRVSASTSTSSFSSASPSPAGTPSTSSISTSISNSSINSSTTTSSRQNMAQSNTVAGSEQREDGDPRALWAAATAASSYPVPAPNATPANYAMAAHQMAWMQQAYSQYMSHYMQFLAATQGGVNNAYPIHTAPTPQQQPAPVRDDNQPAANPAAGGENEEEEGRGHRDWLDWFYIMSRVTVLFSVVYFYSSPVRFFMVTTLGLIMYLYQVGFFRMQGIDGVRGVAEGAAGGVDRDQERENNNVPVGADAMGAAGVGAAGIDQPGADTNATPPPAQPNTERPSVLMLTWSIFCSFLLSLIPEQPNVI